MQQLEAARPGSDDRNLPELQEASLHLDDCQNCGKVFEKLQAIDVRIANVMVDVPVPAGLKERLFESLKLDVAKPAETTVSTASPRKTTPTGFGRLRVRILAAISVSAIVLAALFVLFPKQSEKTPFSLADVRNSANLQLDQLSEFDGNFTPELPQGLWRTSERISLGKSPKGDLKDSQGNHRAASFEIQVSDNRGRTYRGVLLVLPKRLLDDSPSREQFSTESEEGTYAQRPYGAFHTVSWTEGEHVFVCFMPVGDDGMKTLERALFPPFA
jgi:hypothetical protein